MGLDLSDSSLPTPCLVVDRGKMMNNISNLRAKFAETEVGLRPHLKTVKSIHAARLVMPTPAGPATVSTLKEAEEFARHGVQDLLYAVSIAPQKLERVVRILQSGIYLSIITDNLDAATAIVRAARAAATSIPTLIEVDVDGHRSGIELGDEAELLAAARVLHESGCLRGVMTHAGGSYILNGEEALKEAAEKERAGILRMVEILQAHGLTCEVVSIGSTPTAFSMQKVDGITEIRAGVFQFFDLYQAGVGVCSVDDIALSVLTTVIGHQRRKGWTITDSGWMAMSADRGTASQAVDQFYGVVCDVRGNAFGDVVLLRTNQEHGVIAARPGAARPAPELPVGTRVRILPNHACATAAQHDRYEVVDGGTEIVDTWPRFGGW